MSDLRKAVDNDELVLFYQPKVALRGGSELHAEALVRWQHPTRGLVAPVEFIPFAEQTGYIRAITQWVMAHAIAQCAAWRGDGLPMNVSINISARDLMDVELPDRVAALLHKHGCAAQWITLEITESAILDDPDHAIDNLRRLHALGCRLAIDDYGTGYSSLAYLRRLPVHELKIDKSFVLGMARDTSDAVIVRSTIDLAHNMGLVVVAEGVEDEATLERLRGPGLRHGAGLSAQSSARARRTWSRGCARRSGRAPRATRGCCAASSEVQGSGQLACTDGFRKRRLIDYAVGLDSARGAFKTGIHGFLPASAGSAPARFHHAEEPRADGLDAHRARRGAERIRQARRVLRRARQGRRRADRHRRHRARTSADGSIRTIRSSRSPGRSRSIAR